MVYVTRKEHLHPESKTILTIKLLHYNIIAVRVVLRHKSNAKIVVTAR